jgi:hypothetical protein
VAGLRLGAIREGISQSAGRFARRGNRCEGAQGTLLDQFLSAASARVLQSLFGSIAEAIAESIRGRVLIDRLMEPKHQMLVGPSGSCKSFHLQHLVLSLAGSGNEVPIPVDPMGYGGGELSHLLQQVTSPFAEVSVGKLIEDITACGLRPVLVIDPLNE